MARNRTWFSARAGGHRRAEIALHDDIGAFGIRSRDLIDQLGALGEVDVLDVRVNSFGGDVFDGLAIYHALQRHPARVEVTVDGLAASIASVIAMAGDEIAMPANAWMMIHDPSAFVVGTSDDMTKMAETLKRLGRSIAGVYASRTGRPLDELLELMAAETWMDGQAAVDAGFATLLLEPVAIAARATLPGFFSHPPAQLCRPADGATAVPQTHDTTTTRPEDVVASERQRVIAILNAGANLGLTAEAQRMVADGVGADEAATALIEARARRDAAASAVQDMRPSGVEFGRSHDDPKIRADRMAEALACRLTGRAPSDAARPFMSLSAVECTRQLLQARNIDVRGMSSGQVLAAGMHTTSDFPELLGGTGNRILREAYQVAESPLKRIARRRPDAPDFRPLSSLRLGGFGELPEVREAGEVTYGTRSEVAESFSLSQFGKIFALSQQAIVNDDLMAFSDFATAAGRAAAATEAALLYGLLAANPAMSDGRPLFHADHGNLASSGAAITATTLGAARQAMRGQKDPDGTPIAVTPSFLLVGPAKETVAEQTLSPLYMPASAADAATASMRQLEIAVEPRITGSEWFLFASSAQVPVIEYAFLDGAGGPQIETKPGWQVLGVEFRVVLNFGAGVVDWRGAFKNPGA